MKAVSLGAALAVSLLAVSAHAKGEQCFRIHNLQGYTVADDEQTLYLRDLSRRVFRMDFASRCPGLAFKERVALEPAGVSDLICQPIDINVRLRQNGISSTCIVAGLTPLSADQLKALPKKLRP